MKMQRFLMLAILSSILFFSCKNLEEKSDAYGNFEATETTISAQASGEILELNLEEGDFVPSGKVLGWIDTTDLDLKRQQLLAQKQAVWSKTPGLKAQIAVYQQQKENILRDQARIKKMFADGAATQKQVDDIDGQIEVINRQIETIKTQETTVQSEMSSLEKQIGQVNTAIAKAVIINPVDGVVLTKFSNAHEIAVPGKALYKIADLREMKLKVYVSGDQLPNVKIGQEVEVLVDKDKKENQKLTGTVSWVSESAEFTPKIIQTKEERVNLVYAVKVLVKNDGTLKIGMPGEVNF